MDSRPGSRLAEPNSAVLLSNRSTGDRFTVISWKLPHLYEVTALLSRCSIDVQLLSLQFHESAREPPGGPCQIERFGAGPLQERA